MASSDRFHIPPPYIMDSMSIKLTDMCSNVQLTHKQQDENIEHYLRKDFIPHFECLTCPKSRAPDTNNVAILRRTNQAGMPHLYWHLDMTCSKCLGRGGYGGFMVI